MTTYRKIRIFIILLAMLASGCSNQASPPTATPTMGPVDVVKAYEDAFNSHDVPGTMAWLTEDVSLFQPSWGDSKYQTRQEVLKLHEFYLAGPTEVHYTDCQTSADTVICKMTHSDACSRAFGVNVIPGSAFFTMLNDKIQTIIWDETSDELTYYGSEWGKFSSWFGKIRNRVEMLF